MDGAEPSTVDPPPEPKLSGLTLVATVSARYFEDVARLLLGDTHGPTRDVEPVTGASYSFGALALVVAVAALAFAAHRVRTAFLPRNTGALGHLTEFVVGLSLLVAVLEIAGSFGLFSRWVVVLAVPAVAVIVGIGAPRLHRRVASGDASPPIPSDRSSRGMVAIAIGLVAIVVAQWLAHAAPGLTHGMYDLDTLRYHGPFAARWVQEHNVFGIEYTSAQNQELYFPGNSELLSGYGILLFGRDLLTPLANFGWLALALLAAWCAGTRLGHGPAAVAGVAAVCSTPLLASIAPASGRNDIAALALVLAAAALLVHALPSARGPAHLGGYAVAGAAAGLAIGTKLTTMAPLIALGVGAVLVTRPRARSILWLTVPALMTGGYWYARNAAHTGTPFPWFRIPLGFVTLAGPPMPYNDRFGFSVAHYAASASFWSDKGLPDLQKSFGSHWPLLVLGALAAAVLAATGRRRRVDRLVGVATLVAFGAYVFTPWSAGGPDGDPHLFALDLRFLAPTLGLGAIAAARPTLARLAIGASAIVILSNQLEGRGRWPAAVPLTLVVCAIVGAALTVVWISARTIARSTEPSRRIAIVTLGAMVLGVALLGAGLQDTYLDGRYAVADAGYTASYPMFRFMQHQRVAVGGFAADYPLFGESLTNRVQYIGVSEPNGEFRPPATCTEWLSRLRAGRYDYVVISTSPAALHPHQPPEVDWTKRDPVATQVLRHGVTSVFRLHGLPDPATCQ